MKRYLVFAYEKYYPEGGWNDFSGDFDTIEEARRYIKESLSSYYYTDIVDSFGKYICE